MFQSHKLHSQSNASVGATSCCLSSVAHRMAMGVRVGVQAAPPRLPPYSPPPSATPPRWPKHPPQPPSLCILVPGPRGPTLVARRSVVRATRQAPDVYISATQVRVCERCDCNFSRNTPILSVFVEIRNDLIKKLIVFIIVTKQVFI